MFRSRIAALVIALGVAGCATGPTYAQLQAELNQRYQECLKIAVATVEAACVQDVISERASLAERQQAMWDALADAPPAPVFTPTPAPTFAPIPVFQPTPVPQIAPLTDDALTPQPATPTPRFVPVVPGPATGAGGGGLLAQ